MKRARNVGQKRLIDPWEALDPHVLRLLRRGWPAVFRRDLLPRLPVALLDGMYSDRRFGRPGKDLYTLLGAVILQQVLDLTDAQTVRQLACSIEWQYALNIPDGAVSGAAYICERTLWEARHHLVNAMLDGRDAGGIIFETLTDELVRALGVDTSRQRLDGTHVQSDMAKLNRVRILFRALRGFLRELHREHARIFERHVPAEWIARIVEPKNDGVFGQSKPSESRERIAELGAMAAEMEARFATHATVKAMASFELMVRVLHEQCEVTFTESDELVVVERPSEAVSSGSVQNPSDPDATYSGYKGQGYTAQIAETIPPEDDGESSDGAALRPPNLAIHVELHAANAFEGDALAPAIDRMVPSGNWPSELQADAAYGSDENVCAAADVLIELVSPVPGEAHPSARKPNNGAGSSEKSEQLDPVTLNEFALSEPIGTGGEATPRIEKCPAGHAPIARKPLPDGGETVTFDGAICATCPLRDRCPTRPRRSRIKRDGRKSRKQVRQQRTRSRSQSKSDSHAPRPEGPPDRHFRATGKSLRLTRRRAIQQTDAFKSSYRWRSGIEALNSVLKRQFGFGRVRYRRFNRVRFAVKLKVLGLNLMRASRHEAAKARRSVTSGPTDGPSTRRRPTRSQSRRAHLRLVPRPTYAPLRSILANSSQTALPRHRWAA